MRGVTLQEGIQFACLAISTHTPHARRDATLLISVASSLSFQLTRLMRGVTIAIAVFDVLSEFQLTRLMRGVTQRKSNVEIFV